MKPGRRRILLTQTQAGTIRVAIPWKPDRNGKPQAGPSFDKAPRFDSCALKARGA